MKKHPLQSLFILFIAILVASCGKTTSFEPDDIPYHTNQSFGEASAAEGSTVLPEETLSKLSDVSDNGSTFTFRESDVALESIENGKIIFGGVSELTPQGVLRRVTDVSKSDGKITLETEHIPLEEAFSEASVELSETLTTSDARSMKVTLPLMGTSEVRHIDSRKKNAGNFSESFDDVVYDPDGIAGNGDEVKLTGSISLNTDFTFNFDIDDYQLTYLLFTLNQNNQSSLTLSTGGTFGLPDPSEIAILEMEMRPILFQIGFFPIVVTPKLTIRIGASGQLAAEVSTGVTASITTSSGVRYENGNWEPVESVTPAFDANPPTIEANAQFRVYGGPKLELDIYNLIGPSVSVDGYSELNMDVTGTPLWQLYGGIRADAGIKVEAFSSVLADKNFPGIIDYRVLLAEHEGGGTGSIEGSVRDAVSGDGISGIQITVSNAEGEPAGSGTSDELGQFTIELSAGENYKLTFAKEGYLTAEYDNIEVTVDETTFLEPVLQIDEMHDGVGGVTGEIVNALNGEGIGGLTIGLRPGINTTVGPTVTSTITGSGGSYTLDGLEAGNYTGEITGSGYNTSYFSILVLGGTVNPNQNATVTPELPGDEYRFVLTWGESPRDLDSHLTGPDGTGGRFHVYYSDRMADPFANLDHDDTSSYGPETITITEQPAGTFRYSVHDFTNRSSTNSQALSQSQAVVRIYKGSEQVRSFNVPSNQGGTLWTVFELNGDDITPINSLSYESEPEAVTKRLYRTDGDLIRMVPPKN